MKRTTIFADESMLGVLRRFARTDGKSLSSIIREALARYIAHRERPSRPPSFLGMGKSGRSDVAERHEELLWKKRTKRSVR